MTMEKISEAILDKVKAEADQILKEAEERAAERIKVAKQQQSSRYEEEKTRLLADANSEASKLNAQASISIRLELLKVKNEVINEIVTRVKKNLADSKGNADLITNLIKESIQAVDSEKVVVYVSKADMDITKDAVKQDKELSAKVSEIKETDSVGGVIIEDTEGKISIDNTYETRLETLLPKVLPEISRELFGS